MTAAVADLPSLLRVLADETRLRVLGLLGLGELGVGELAEILGISGTRLANHLRVLRETDLLLDRREASWRFVRINRDGALPPLLWEAVASELASSPKFQADRVRLAEVLEQRRARSRQYFDQVAPVWDDIGSDFSTGAARQRVAASLIEPDLVVADVGSGTGYLSAALAPLVTRLILVDHAPAMLARARENLATSRAEVIFRAGELDALPLADGEVHAIVAGLVLHHAPDPGAFLTEAWRVLRPGGALAILDLLPHRESWLRDRMADLRLGIAPDELAQQVVERGFADVCVEAVADRYVPERPEGGRADLPLFLLRARRRDRSPLDF